MEPWIKFIEFVTKPVSVASTFVVFVATAFLLFAPPAMLVRLGLTQPVTQYRSAIGLGFIFSTAWVVVTIASAGYRITVSRIGQFRWKREQRRKTISAIPQLTDSEREILGYLLAKNQRMFTNTPDCGHAATLYAKGLVVLAAKPGQRVNHFEVPFEIPEHVWEILLKHKNEFPEPVSDRHPWRVHWMG